MNELKRKYDYVDIWTAIMLIIILITAIWTFYMLYLHQNHIERCIQKYQWIDIKEIPVDKDKCFRVLNNQ